VDKENATFADGIRTYILLCGGYAQIRTNVLSGKCAIKHLHTG